MLRHLCCSLERLQSRREKGGKSKQMEDSDKKCKAIDSVITVGEYINRDVI
jgi:hypothetical protein